MKRYLLLVSLFITAISLNVSAGEQASACTPASGSPIRLGAVFPPDTLMSVDAADPYRAVSAMVAAVNECGGINGRPVEVVYVPAANRQEALKAVEHLADDVALVIGSGSGAISEVLLDASAEGAFVYWEVSEPLEAHGWAFSPRPTGYQLGAQAAAFVQGEAVSLLNGSPLRVALVHENRALARAVASGVIETLNAPPVIARSYENRLSSGYRVAVSIREAAVNVVIVAAFETDADRFWYDLREADANVSAWVQVGGDSYRRNMCARFGNTDGLISISAAGPVSADYRLSLGAIFERYAASYVQRFSRAPSERADLAASGVYLLLRDVLPNVAGGNYTPDGIRSAILASDVAAPAGVMGEGLRFDAGSRVNLAAVALVQQRQDDRFCTIYPTVIATCAQSLLPFPTWRERAVAAERAGCTDW